MTTTAAIFRSRALTDEVIASMNKVSPIPTDFQIGDVVIFTNDQGVVFDRGYKVIGFSSEPLGERFIHLDFDCWWFPVRPDMLQLKDRPAQVSEQE